MRSNFMRINLNELTEGLIFTVLASLFATLQSSITKDGIHLDLGQMPFVAYSSALGYVSKALLTNSDGKFIRRESKK